MKKLKFISFVLTAALLCGCSKSGSTSIASESSDKSSGFSQIENPFSENTESESVSEVIGSNSSSDGESSDINSKYQYIFDTMPFEELRSGAFIIDEEKEWIDSETLKIPIYVGGYKPKETTRCGFIVLIDGLVQEYSSEYADDNKEPAIFHTFKYRDSSNDDPDAEKSPNYYITLKPKLDKNITTHTINTIKITNAAYFGRYDPFGLNLEIGSRNEYGYEIDITDADVEYADFKVYEAPKAVPYTEEQRQNLQINSNDEDYNYWPRLTTPDHAYDLTLQPAIDKSYVEDGKLKLKFVGGGATPGKQKLRGSVFVNGKHTKFNGDYDYFEFTVEGGCVNDIDIELENINVGDSVFAVAELTNFAGWRKDVTYVSCNTDISTVVEDANNLLGNNSSQPQEDVSLSQS
ncbi:MAG: hypothetical protein MR364_06170 [Oscillospiraceae bacterium]|nr:hypothetical protein [Oscillospiraceae bacterium]